VTGLAAQTSALGDQAPQYQAVADQVRLVYDTLSAALDSCGACWGNDEAGQAFAQKYVGPALTALSQLDSANQGLQSMAGGVASWAKNYLDTDQNLQSDVASGLGNP
jgi:hypothetical protein